MGGNISRFHDFERHGRGLDQVAQLMHQKADAFVFVCPSVDRGLITLAAVLRHGTGYRVIQTPIQHSEILGADGRAHFYRECRDSSAAVRIASPPWLGSD
jgi:hypothetical protein